MKYPFIIHYSNFYYYLCYQKNIMVNIPISIKPEREYLHEILKRMHSGKYAIPLFQRDFVWEKKQILDLFDSISRGYPIGSILLWHPQNKDSYPFSKRPVDNEIFENPELDYFILDGRQRLTTFYGCLYGQNESSEKFKVYYNLESEMFEYPSIAKKPVYLVPLHDLYDTFKLLDKLQEIQEKVQDREVARTYIMRAKKMNSVFQGYQIGELLLDNYTLDEAGTVFARINSKGTDISKVSMLQALFYKEGQNVLFSDWISNIKTKLGRWGFERLKEEDILNCCYRYSKLNFYDNNLMEKVEKLDFIHKLNDIEEDLMREAEFLHNECGIISSVMLPYARQWVILAGAFKEKKDMSESYRRELKKWLYYTTVSQAFMNSSMSVVRAQARRFEEFINGDRDSAMDYKPVELPLLNFSFRLTSALSCLLMIALVRNFETKTGNKAVYLGEYKALGGKNPVGIIPYLSENHISSIYSLMNQGCYQDINLESLALNSEMMDAWKYKNKDLFNQLRKTKLINIEKDMLESVGLEVKINKFEND